MQNCMWISSALRYMWRRNNRPQLLTIAQPVGQEVYHEINIQLRLYEEVWLLEFASSWGGAGQGFEHTGICFWLPLAGIHKHMLNLIQACPSICLTACNVR